MMQDSDTMLTLQRDEIYNTLLFLTVIGIDKAN